MSHTNLSTQYANSLDALFARLPSPPGCCLHAPPFHDCEAAKGPAWFFGPCDESVPQSLVAVRCGRSDGACEVRP